jgi:hypothetical protein
MRLWLTLANALAGDGSTESATMNWTFANG